MSQNHKMIMARIVGIIILWVVTLLPVNAYSQDTSVAPGKLLVGTTFKPPVSMKSAGGQWEGLSIELWHRVAQKLGVQYELRGYGSTGEILAAVEVVNGGLEDSILQITHTQHPVDLGFGGGKIKVRSKILDYLVIFLFEKIK